MIIYRIDCNNLSTVATINKTSIDTEDKSFTSFKEYFKWILGHHPSLNDLVEFIIEDNNIRLHAHNIPNITVRSISNLYGDIKREFQKVIDYDIAENEWIADQSDDTLFIKSIESYSFRDDLSVETKNMYLLRAIRSLTKDLS